MLRVSTHISLGTCYDARMDAHQLIPVTRADYEATFGLKTDPDTIGACLYSGDGKAILVEYIFMEPSEEIAILEEMYRA